MLVKKMVYFCRYFIFKIHILLILLLLFSVREKPNDKRSRGCYSLSLCFQQEYHHYIIQHTSNGRLQFASVNKSTRVNQFGSIVQVCRN
jgi:hypothetical protein